MSDLTKVIRWNANFVHGLAQSVLDRAKAVRASLKPGKVARAMTPAIALGKVVVKKKKAPARKVAASTRRPKKRFKKTNG